MFSDAAVLMITLALLGIAAILFVGFDVRFLLGKDEIRQKGWPKAVLIYVLLSVVFAGGSILTWWLGKK